MLTIRCINEKAKVPNASYTLLVGQSYTVGRKGGDISFPEDQSISRNHAEITVEHPSANVSDPLLIPTVVLTDLGSKFGTFTNEGIERRAPISMREPMNLSPGDRFRFGLQWNEFKIEYTPLVVTTSCLKDQPKLKSIIMKIGGHLVPEWTEKCNYVVMDSVTLTVKAVCALLSAKHIVTPAFFDDLYECVKTKKGYPNPNNFLPPIGEDILKSDGLSLQPDERRSQLFEDKTFLFTTQKHLRKVGLAVKCGGGTTNVVSSVSTRDVVKENFIIMKPPLDTPQLDPQVQRCLDSYKDSSKRLIQDSEIGLAAVFISTAKHCNPSAALTPITLPKLVSQTQSSGNTQNSSRMVIPETQDIPTQLSTNSESQSRRGGSSKPTIVKEEPSSSGLEQSSSRASKRNMNGRDTEGSSSKKRSAEESLASNVAATKRLRSAGPVPDKTLSALFGLSDSEDEEAEVVPDIVRESETIDVVPDSPPEQEVSSSIIDVIPPSPDISIAIHDMSDIEGGNSHFQIPTQPETRRATRSRGMTASPEKTPVATSSKRKLRSSEESVENPVPTPSTSKKRKTKVDSSTSGVNENDDLAEKTENLKIEVDPSGIVKTETDDKDKIIPCNIPILVRSVLKTPMAPPKIEVVDGRNIKNFKTFKKVLPLAQQRCNETLGSTSGTSSASRKSVLRKLTFEVFDYSPMISNLQGVPSPPARQEERVQADFDDDDEDEMPSASTYSRTEPSTGRSKRGSRTVELATSAAASRVKRSNSSQQRIASVPPILAFDEEEDEDENDMWGFN